MICSYIPGRVRLRSPRLQDAETVSALVALLKELPGITGFENNLNTGSLLLRFDPDKVDQEAALAALGFLEEEARSEAGCDCDDAESAVELDGAGRIAPWLNQDVLEYAGMFGAFIICMSSAFLRSKGLHIYSGLTLAGLTAQHVFKYRKRLLRMVRCSAGGSRGR